MQFCASHVSTRCVVHDVKALAKEQWLINKSSALREPLSKRDKQQWNTEYLRMGYVSRWRDGCTFRIRKTSWGHTFQVLKEVMAGGTWTQWAADWENTSTRVYTKKIPKNSKTSRVSSVGTGEKSEKSCTLLEGADGVLSFYEFLKDSFYVVECLPHSCSLFTYTTLLTAYLFIYF